MFTFSKRNVTLESWCWKQQRGVQSIPIKMDAKGAIESVCMKGVSVVHNIVKLNISYLHKAVIPWLKSTKTLKTCPSMYYLKNHSLHKLFDAKISLKLISRKHPTWCTVVLETSQNYFLLCLSFQS